MPQDANIKISFTSDTTDAVAGIKKVTDTIKVIPTVSEPATVAVKKVTDTIKVIPTVSVPAAEAVKKLKEGVQGGLTPALNKIPTVSDRASNALLNLNRVVQDAPYGFIGIANNLNPLWESFQRLKETSGSTGSALKSLVSSLAGPGGLGIALAAVSAAIQFMQLGLTMWTRSSHEAKEANDSLVASMGKATAGAEAEASKVGALIAVAKDETQSRQTRTAALNEAQKLYPGYIANLGLETLNTVAAAKALDNLTSALVRKAQANVLNKQLEDQLAKKDELANKSLHENLNLMGKANEWLAKFGENKDALRNVYNDAALKKAQDIHEQQLAINKTIADQQALIGQQATNNDFKLFDPTKLAGAAKEVKTVTDVLKELGSSLKVLDVKSEAESVDVGTAKIGAFETALTSLYKLGLTPTSEAVKELVKQMNLINTPTTLKMPGGQDLGAVGITAPKMPEIVPPDTLPNLAAATAGVQKLNDVIQEQSNIKRQKLIDKDDLEALKAVGDLITNNLTQPFEQFFEVLLTGSGNAAAALVKALEQMILKLIAASLAAAALAALLAYTGIGMATSAGKTKDFGQIFSLLSGLKTAKGGIFSGPSMRMVGEYSGAQTNPEVIAPLDKLKALMGNSNNQRGGVNMFVIRGTDLVAATNRASDYINR